MSELVTELRVIGTDSNIFDTDMNYVIPLYQRAYACCLLYTSPSPRD